MLIGESASAGGLAHRHICAIVGVHAGQGGPAIVKYDVMCVLQYIPGAIYKHPCVTKLH